MKAVAGLLATGLVLAGCAHPSSGTYESADVGRALETAQGSVVSSRPVRISGDVNAVGPLAGAAAGAAGTAIAFDSRDNTGLIALLGGLVGAGAGYLAQKQLNNRDGIEYVLEMEDGRTVTLVQNRESGEAPLPEGTPVLVQVSGQYARVIPDPRAERVGGADWVDPDAQPAAGPVAEEAPVGAAGDPEPPEEPPAVVGQQQ
jgi:outer membrane lipoprotein SlyB